MSKIITCGTCNTEMASDAKACPKCGSPNKKKGGCIKIVGIAFAVIIGLAIIGAITGGGGKKGEKGEIERAGAEQISDIQWEEIDKIYNLKSSSTELQKKEAWKNYEGKKVQWSGTVTSVGETFGTLQLQVKLNPNTLISDVLVSLKDSARSEALKLKEGDTVTFQGTLDDWGTLMPITLDQGVITK